VVITSPRNNASVSGTLVTVNATATDSGGVKYATVRVNGAPRGTLTTGPYTFKVRLSKGTHSIVVEAMDKTGNIGKATVKVTANTAPPAKPKGSNNISPAPKPPGSSPTPKPPGSSGSTAKGLYGQNCTDWKDCKSGMCAHDASLQRSYCTKTCNVTSPTSCPSGSSCLGSIGGSYVCAPNLADNAAAYASGQVVGAGCSLGAPDSPAPPPLFALLALLALALRRR